MRRTRAIANSHFAGLLIVAAIVHLATILTTASLVWAAKDRGHLLVATFLLGFLPAAAAIYFGLRGWSVRGTRSWACSTAGLVVLLAALAVSHRSGAF